MNNLDQTFLKKTNERLERESRLKKKDKGLAADQPTSPRRATRKIERHIKDRAKLLEKQEAELMLDFIDFWGADPSEDMVDFLWRFLVYLRQKKMHFVQEDDVFVVPFSKLAMLKNLK